MNVSDLICVLEQFPSDCGVFLGDCFCCDVKNLFAVYDDGVGGVVLCDSPECVDGVGFLKENMGKVWFNVYDSFTLYDSMSGDYVSYRDGDLYGLYENLNSDICSCNDFDCYMSDDFLTVGGLKKFFDGVPNGTPVNLIVREGIEQGVINSIQKFDVEYLTGDVENVEYENITELGLVFGLPLYGSDDSLKLNDSVLKYEEEEIENLIKTNLKSFFTENNINLSDNEKESWLDFVVRLCESLHNYYDIYRRVNGSVDSNGLLHLYDMNEPFKKINDLEN